MLLSAAQMRCLLSILSLKQSFEDIYSKDVAKLLDVTKPAVHKMLVLLGKNGLIHKEPYGTIHLTEQGLIYAMRLEKRKEKLLLLFSKSFELPLDECSVAAILLMSGLREGSCLKLEKACAPIFHQKRQAGI